MHNNDICHLADGFIQSDLVMRPYIYYVWGGPGIQTHYPGFARAMLYQLSYRGPAGSMYTAGEMLYKHTLTDNSTYTH